MSSRRSNKVSITLLSLLFASAAPAYSAVHSGLLVGRMQMPDAARDCVLFTLSAEPVADAAVPGNPWMAIPRSQNGFKEIFAFLLWAKSTSTPIAVQTTGQVAEGCTALGDIAGVAYVWTP